MIPDYRSGDMRRGRIRDLGKARKVVPQKQNKQMIKEAEYNKRSWPIRSICKTQKRFKSR